MEKKFSDYIKSRLAKVKKINVRLNVYKILNEDLDHVQELCQLISEDIVL